MYQLVYVSAFGLQVRPSDVADILDASRRNNRRDQLTGLLIADGQRFLQVLEGDRARVLATFKRIEQDRRHFGIVTLSRHDIHKQEFGEWNMAYREVARVADELDLTRKVEAMVADLPPATRAPQWFCSQLQLCL